MTRAEILQALHNPLGVHTMVGVKYRTRSMMGRCQGGYCQMRIAEMIEEELREKAEDVRYARQGSWLFSGAVRGEEAAWKQEMCSLSAGVRPGWPRACRFSAGRPGYFDRRTRGYAGRHTAPVHPRRFRADPFHKTLSGPEYAQRFIDLVEENGIPIWVDAAVTDVSTDKTVTVVRPEGLTRVKAKAVVFAMGCASARGARWASPASGPRGGLPPA